MKVPIDHRQRARAAWPYLVQTARQGRRITYGELCALIGLHHRAAGWFLGVIQRFCRQNSLPPLQAVAVNKQTRVPGSGYVATPRGGRAYRKALGAVYGEKWPRRAPF